MFPKLVAASALASAAALAFWLVGCAVQPPRIDAERGLGIPEAWSQPLPSGDAPLAAWWRGFGDPVLVQLVERAQAANTDILLAQANLRQARALRDAAAAGLWPRLSVTATAQRNRSGGAAHGSLFDAGFDASWEPDVFGAAGHAVASSQAEAAASAGTLASIQVSIAGEVAVSYLQLRGTQMRAAVARQNLAAQEQTLQIAVWREQAGLGSALEPAQARTAVEQTRALLPLLDAAAAQTSHALAVLSGQPPAALDTMLSGAMPLPQPPRNLAVAIPAQALRQRPDVLAAEWRLRAAAERVAQADANQLPAFDLHGSLAWSARTLGSLASVAAARSLVATIGQTLFDRGQRSAQLAAQQAAFDGALQTYRARVLAALQDVEDALAALSASVDRLAALQAAVAAAGDAAELAGHRYSSGVIDFQTVLDTQRNLLSVQDGLVSAQTDVVTSHVRLYKALGGGWTSADLPQENRL